MHIVQWKVNVSREKVPHIDYGVDVHESFNLLGI